MTTSLQKDALLARFSALAYNTTTYLENSSNLPNGWSLADKHVEPPFAAFAFKNQATGEIIIAYRGTDGASDLGADGSILRGTWDTQFDDGIKFAKKVRDDDLLNRQGSDSPSQILVTGHSLGGAIAQIVSHAFGFDGSTIDPGAAGRIVQTAGFKAAVLEAGLPAGGRGAPASLTNHLVVASSVSNGTGAHVGGVSFVPSLTFSSEQAVRSVLLAALFPPAALALYEARHPSTPQAAAHILPEGINPDTANAETLQAARAAAQEQWLKVIAVDLSGEGIQLQSLPDEIAEDINSLRGIGPGAVPRFDADNDGFAEATQWLAPGSAILGLDRNGNGILDAANELFNAIDTPFDQRGIAALKYYDANADGQLTSADPVWKLLRLWIDTNGNARATASETFTLQQVPAGGLTASATSVQSIDLHTQTIHLANGGTLRLTPLRVQAQLQGVKLFLHESNSNLSVFHEDGRTENHIISVMQAP